jgi:hypothetical protein
MDETATGSGCSGSGLGGGAATLDALGCGVLFRDISTLETVSEEEEAPLGAAPLLVNDWPGPLLLLAAVADDDSGMSARSRSGPEKDPEDENKPVENRSSPKPDSRVTSGSCGLLEKRLMFWGDDGGSRSGAGAAAWTFSRMMT